MNRSLTFLQGAYEAQLEEMKRDDSIILLGQDLEANLYGSSESFVDIFGRARVRDLPISEAASVGMAAGAALTGLRPIVDLTFANFMYNAMDQLANQVAKMRYMSGGQATLPLVFRSILFHKGGNAAHHSDRPYPAFMGIPGLKIIVPTTGPDLKGLLKSAIRDDNPVLCFEDSNLWGKNGVGHMSAEEDNADYLVPLGVGKIRRAGDDITVVAIAGAVNSALTAADELARRGVELEIVDPRTLVPMDWDLIAQSVRRTHRLIVVDPAVRTCSAASEIAAFAAEELFELLRCPVLRVTSPDIPIPYAKSMEEGLYPTSAKIVDAVERTLK